MKRLLAVFFSIAMLLMFWSAVEGQAQKEVSIKGSVTCAKCDLNVKGQDTCATVVVEKVGGKDVVYYFDADGHKKFHGPVCKAAKAGTVTGTVSEKDGKKTVTVKDVKY